MIKKLLVFALCICLFGCFQSEEEKAISLVENGYLNIDKSITLGTALSNNSHFSDKSWSSFTSDMGRRIVEFRATVNNDILSGDNLRFADENNINTKFIIQFVINNDDTFDISYIGGELEAPDNFASLFNETEYNTYFSEGWKIPLEGALKSLYDNKVSIFLLAGLGNIKKEFNEIKLDTIRSFVRGQAFDYNEAGLPLRVTLHINIHENTTNGALLGYDFNNGWGHIFANCVFSNGSTCSFFNKYNVDDNKMVLKNEKCPALITFNEGATIINIQDSADCGFCGIGGGLDGEYKFIGKASFYLAKGSDGDVSAYILQANLAQD
ncbi:MAG: hypothetical protein H0S80_10815 [Desulfovibrionaceae bacterium]|nr:hypothetical protein [Desulfovibrionaceae bacterium]